MYKIPLKISDDLSPALHSDVGFLEIWYLEQVAEEKDNQLYHLIVRLFPQFCIYGDALVQVIHEGLQHQRPHEIELVMLEGLQHLLRRRVLEPDS